MENVLTILFIIGGIAISLYMSAKKKEQEKAKRMQKSNPLPTKSILETILMDTGWGDKKDEAIQKEVQLVQPCVVQTVQKEKILTSQEKSEKPPILFEEGDGFEKRHFNLRDAILYETILKRKYIK